MLQSSLQVAACHRLLLSGAGARARSPPPGREGELGRTELSGQAGGLRCTQEFVEFLEDNVEAVTAEAKAESQRTAQREAQYEADLRRRRQQQQQQQQRAAKPEESVDDMLAKLKKDMGLD